MSQIKRFVEDNKIIFFPIFLFLGIILAFFGLKMNKLAFFLAGFFLGTGAILLFCVDFVLNRDSDDKAMWICFFVSAMFGAMAGYITVKIRKVGAFALGGCLGYFLSLILYATFLYKI